MSKRKSILIIKTTSITFKKMIRKNKNHFHFSYYIFPHKIFKKVIGYNMIMTLIHFNNNRKFTGYGRNHNISFTQTVVLSTTELTKQ